MNKRETLREVTYGGINYACPTWEQMGEYTFNLAREIDESGRKFDRVVALAKGGWTWSKTLVDYLNIDKLSSIGVKSYGGINDQSAEVEVFHPLTDRVHQERILIFDEVVDSGKTIIKSKEIVTVLGCREVAVAALCYKPRSKATPEYYAFTTDAWVVFPHERREFINDAWKRWSDENVPADMIKTRLLDIGLPKDQVDYFSPR